MMMAITVRPFILADEQLFKHSISTLQDYEHQFSPDDMLPGEQIVDRWFDHTMMENEMWDGIVYVAEVGAGVEGHAKETAGFMSVRRKPTTLTEEIYVKSSEGAYVTDFQVLSAYRGLGVGRRLLEQADEYARERGLPYVILEVFAHNSATEFYRRHGFVDLMTTMVKPASEALP